MYDDSWPDDVVNLYLNEGWGTELEADAVRLMRAFEAFKRGEEFVDV